MASGHVVSRSPAAQDLASRVSERAGLPRNAAKHRCRLASAAAAASRRSPPLAVSPLALQGVDKYENEVRLRGKEEVAGG